MCMHMHVFIHHTVVHVNLAGCSDVRPKFMFIALQSEESVGKATQSALAASKDSAKQNSQWPIRPIFETFSYSCRSPVCMEGLQVPHWVQAPKNWQGLDKETMPQEIFGALLSSLWCLGLILYEVFQEWIVSFKKNTANFKTPAGCKASRSSGPIFSYILAKGHFSAVSLSRTSQFDF